MWVLNAPCLVSPTPSYQRVIGICNQHFMLVNQGEWGNKLREINTNKHLLEDSISRGHDYLQQHHTREILIQHWKDALNSVSPRPENAND
jgi:mannose/cellobiose epimerase-like protein (N-acyl-D-glucosamine 2-epimerase family)